MSIDRTAVMAFSSSFGVKLLQKKNLHDIRRKKIKAAITGLVRMKGFVEDGSLLCIHVNYFLPRFSDFLMMLYFSKILTWRMGRKSKVT